MSDARVLLWNGHDGVVLQGAPPAGGAALLHAEHTLVELRRPRALAALGRLDGAGPLVAAAVDIASNRVPIDAAACLQTTADDPVAALLLPLVAEIVGALHRADLDIGWNAVVTGDGVRAELLMQLAPVAGARHVLALRDADAPETSELCLRGEPAHVRQALAERLAALRGPVLACDTSGDPAWQQTLLAALPAESTLLLLGRPTSAGAAARVNIYRDVHRKNVRIEAAPVRPDRRSVEGAARLLAGRRIDARRLDVPVQPVGLGQAPSVGGRWAILRWAGS